MSQKIIDPRGKPKKFIRNRDEKVRKIIATTFQLIAEKDYDNLTTNHIAKASNISIGTIYRYFPEGKSSIVLAVAEDMYQKLPLGEIIHQMEIKNLHEVIITLLRFYVKYHRDNFKLIKATEKASLSSSIVRDEIDSFTNQIINNIMAVSEQFADFAKFSLEELQHKIIIIIKSADSIIHRHLLISPIFESDDELINFLVDIVEKLVESQILINQS
jgi:AcrR family transcriptional regulator